MASSSRGFPTERLDAGLGRFSREDNPTFTFSTVNFHNGAPGFSREEKSASNFHFFLTKTKPKIWILLVFQTVAFLSVAWLALTISTAVICFILRFLLLLVLRSSSKKLSYPFTHNVFHLSGELIEFCILGKPLVKRWPVQMCAALLTPLPPFFLFRKGNVSCLCPKQSGPCALDQTTFQKGTSLIIL